VTFKLKSETTPTERPPLVGEASANLLQIGGCRVVSAADPLRPYFTFSRQKLIPFSFKYLHNWNRMQSPKRCVLNDGLYSYFPTNAINNPFPYVIHAKLIWNDFYFRKFSQRADKLDTSLRPCLSRSKFRHLSFSCLTQNIIAVVS
jgi:hypothetical protein